MRSASIAVIGDKDLVAAFKAVGMDVFEAITPSQAQEQIKALAMKYSVIFITEDLAEQIEEYIARYKNQTYPIIIPIPSGNGATGYGMLGIKKNVERAIGADLLFNDNK